VAAEPAPPEAEPELLERGRYAVTSMPDGGWVITRAIGICETCQACGCGEPGDPVPVPSMVISLAKAQMGNGGGPLKTLKAMMSRG
jgi:hypothetical protein